jgi:tRNA-splicing ligase RtcB
MTSNFEVIYDSLNRNNIVKAWIKDVDVDEGTFDQLTQVTQMPFIYKWVAAMPDCHVGLGATIGSVVPTKGAVIPAAVGVDIGCGMQAVMIEDPHYDPQQMFDLISETVPHGRTANGGKKDVGSWWDRRTPEIVHRVWEEHLHDGWAELTANHRDLMKANSDMHLGTLGTGNHFIEICHDTDDNWWVMLHSGSRGIGNKIGSYFIKKAKEYCKRHFIELPDPNLAYFVESTAEFVAYMQGMSWAQSFAKRNRDCMMELVCKAIRAYPIGEVIDCHHNFIAEEHHFGQNVYVTRKGAVRARLDEKVIIPGSMGAKSYICTGKGNRDSFESCAHGAGRRMSRRQAKESITLKEHTVAVEGVVCKKDESVLDESPAAYKDITAVMHAQSDLVEPIHQLKQICCIKG